MAEPIRTPDPDEAPQRENNIIGKPFRRVDGRAKVTGATKFADDLAFPRMGFVRLVRSTVPHARIKSIDVSEASQVPGFLAISPARKRRSRSASSPSRRTSTRSVRTASASWAIRWSRWPPPRRTRPTKRRSK
jgi:CO/xanthine dehydrogenase Mo-binding subunit